jgi:hypothetical protein
MTSILCSGSVRNLWGVLALISASASAWWAFTQRKDYVLFPVLLGIAVVISADGVLMLLIGLACRGMSLGRLSLKGCVGDELPTTKWPRWVLWQPLVRVKVEWISPSATCEISSTSQGAFEKVQFVRRLKSTAVTRYVHLEDWLGIWAWGLKRTDQVELLVEPSSVFPGGQPPRIHHHNGQGEEGEGAADGDFVEFRTYQQGDAANRVMWKLFARTGNLFVRRAEKSGSALIGIFLVCSQSDEPAAELAWYVTNKHAERSQDFFGENWLFGTSAEYAEGRERRPLVSSADWRGSREMILSSGAETGELTPSELRRRINAFIQDCGPGVTSVVVLMGKAEAFPEEALDCDCQYLQVERSADQKQLEWELVYR